MQEEEAISAAIDAGAVKAIFVEFTFQPKTGVGVKIDGRSYARRFHSGSPVSDVSEWVESIKGRLAA